MENAILDFVDYLHNTKKTSYNTEVSYKRDLKKLEIFLQAQGVREVRQIDASLLNAYILYLERQNFAPSSVSRNVASVRAFFQYLFRCRMIEKDPSDTLRPPRVEKKTPEILTVEEVDLLMKQPDVETAKGIRDRAMLELLYATGMRVSELIHLKKEDINLHTGYVTCSTGEKNRQIPFGNVCRRCLEDYLIRARETFLDGREVAELFTNCSGKPMSRQGFWKLLKGYAGEAGITKEITPHTLRHSFAAHMIQNGAELKSVQEMLGHSDISSTHMYLNLHANRMRDIYLSAHPRC